MVDRHEPAGDLTIPLVSVRIQLIMTYLQLSSDVDIDIQSWAAETSESQSQLVELSQFVSFIANIQNNGLQG
jgi:hypothetical protein